VPELPEVEALTRFLGEKTTGASIVRVELATLSA
jgi:formamidopyrimidine-DNA glycosylase